MSNENHYIQMGKYFGYPMCCIDFFVERMRRNNTYYDELTKEQIEIADKYFGFIPCVGCAKKISKGIIYLEDLITNRKHSAPFPKINEQEMIKFIESNYTIEHERLY